MGYISALHTHKGILDLLEAARILRQRRDIVFHIYAGNPRSEEFYRSWIGRALSLLGWTRDLEREAQTFLDDERLHDTVHLHGTPPPSSLFSSLDIMTFPGHTNALPQSIAEGGACAIPAVVTLRGRVEDIVQDEHTGLVTSPRDPQGLADAIVRLADDEQMRRRLGENARQRYRIQFDPVEIGRKTFDLYQRILREFRRQNSDLDQLA